MLAFVIFDPLTYEVVWGKERVMTAAYRFCFG